MKLGAKIRQLRAARNWSQEQLARESSLSRSHVSQIENDKIPNLGIGTIVSLANALQIDKDSLLEAAGIELGQSSTNSNAVTIHDPEVRKWITAENLSMLPSGLQRAISAIIKDYIESGEEFDEHSI